MQIKLRKVLALLSCVAMLCTVLPFGALMPVTAAVTNLVTNGDFESGDYTGWTKNGMTPTVSADAAYSGSYGVHLYGTNAWASFNQYITLEASTMYRISFWYKSAADAAVNVGVEVKTKNDSGSYSVKTPFLVSGSSSLSASKSVTTWTRVESVFVTAATGDMSHLLTFYRGNGTADTTTPASVYLDDIVLTKIDVASASNMVQNGGFESTLDPWTQLTSSSQTMALSTDAHEGSNSVVIPFVARNLTVNQVVTVEKNTDYVVTYYYKSLDSSSSTAKNILFGAYGVDATNNGSSVGDLAKTAAVLKIANTEWTQGAYLFNSGDNTEVRLAFSGSSSTNPTNRKAMLVDDLFMTKAVAETPDEPEFTGIVNGDFETGSKDPWVSGSSSAAITINSTNAHGGSYGAMVPARNRTFTARQDVTVKADTNYTVTFWYKSTDATQETHLLFGVYAADATASNATALATQVALDNTKTDWTEVTYVFNSGSNTTVRVAFGSDNSSCLITDYMYVDDIVMVEGGEISDEPDEYVGAHPQTMTSGADIRVMTYNVLADDDATTGMHFGEPLADRGTKAAAMINYYNPDVIAFQEFTTNWYTVIRTNCPQYEFVNADLDDVTDSMCSALAYNPSVVRVVASGVYKMANTYWSHQRMRYLNWAVFEVIATGERFIASSTHPDAGDLLTAGSSDTNDFTGDGVYEPAGYWRPTQIREVVEQLDNLFETYGCPIIAGGDYNCDSNGIHYHDTVSYKIMTDAGYTDTTDGLAKDHIFYNAMATHLYAAKVTDAALSGASDHDAFFADIQFLDEYTTPIRNVKDYIKTQGRTYMKDGAMWLDFSASGIEFSANCEGKVALNLNVKSIKNTDATYGGIYFTVIVDGVKKDRAQCRITSTGNVQLVLAEDLPAGNHTFEVYRQTEHRGAEVGISSIVLNGTFNEKPADNRLYIEFIGDSISTGYGALGNSSSEGSADCPLYQDATVAYPYLTAKALGADFSDVAYSGLGCKYGYSGSLSMQTVYTAQRYQYDQTTQYNFSARQPDVVVIALGTNDIANQTDAALREAGYQEMLDLVRAKNPNSKIVWIANMMKSDDNAMIEALIEENGGAAEGLFYLGLTQNTSGAGYHPSAAGQQVFADELVAFLNEEVLVRYVGDEMYDNQDGFADVYSGDGHAKTQRMEMDGDKLGLAFSFQINATGIGIKDGTITQADLTNAYVDVFGDGTQYKLVRMGAVVSNDPNFGLGNMKLTDVDGVRVIDVNATHLYDLEPGESAQFAVRITNIPLSHEATIIYARGYYVFEYEGREVVVYDDIQSANYINKYDSNDGALEW